MKFQKRGLYKTARAFCVKAGNIGLFVFVTLDLLNSKNDVANALSKVKGSKLVNK